MIVRTDCFLYTQYLLLLSRSIRELRIYDNRGVNSYSNIIECSLEYFTLFLYFAQSMILLNITRGS